MKAKPACNECHTGNNDLLPVLNSSLPSEYREWLNKSNTQDVRQTQGVRQWEELLRCDPEAALCEAAFWRTLTLTGAELQLVPRNNDNTPDFECTANGTRFFVEVTCIKIDTFSNHTGLPHMAGPSTGWHRDANQLIFNEASRKAKQCKKLNNPCLLAIGTFHSMARVCLDDFFLSQLLAGKAEIQVDIDTRRGRKVEEPRVVATKEASVFLRKDSEIKYARSSISAILIAGLGYDPPVVVGLLHPGAVRPFDPDLINGVKFWKVETSEKPLAFRTGWVKYLHGTQI